MSKSKDKRVAFAAAVVRGCIRLLGRQPLKVHYVWSKGISWFLRKVVHYREEVVYINLGWAFPEKSYREIKDIAKAYYDHMADIIVEAVWFGGSSPERLHRQRLVEIANIDVLHGLMDSGRSVVVLDSHCGNWELLGGYQQYVYGEAQRPVSKDSFFVVYKELSNKVFDRVFHDNRKNPVPDYKGLVESKGLLRHFLSHRNDRFIYLVNNDQYPKQAGVDVGTFLNQQTTALAATASMAHKLGMAVVFMRMDNDRKGHYTISFETIAEDASRMDPVDITREYMRRLEAEIRENPANWLWSHMRWKNKTKRNI